MERVGAAGRVRTGSQEIRGVEIEEHVEAVDDHDQRGPAIYKRRYKRRVKSQRHI